MSIQVRVIFLCSALGLLIYSTAQHSTAQHSTAQTPTSEEISRDILNQSLAASGAGNVQSFTASGTTTYFWAGERIQAVTTVRAKGGDQFRLDANVPGGTRTISFNHRTGRRKDADGKLAEIPAHNTLTAGILTFPYPSIAATLADPSVTVSYVGLVEAGAQKLHQIRLTRNFPKESDPDGTLARLAATDYFVDAQTFLVAKTADLTHPKETLTESYTHEVEFESYTPISGIAVPTVVREKVGGQPIWELRLSSINFNTNLTDADFTLQ